jgi:dTDP-4-dehydrorhamnose 3,5-epimerase
MGMGMDMAILTDMAATMNHKQILNIKEMDGLVVIRPKVFRDDRGYFYESYNKVSYSALGIKEDFIQDNESCSKKNVLRGLHFQNPPFAQGKLIRVVKGAIWDVAVDIRKNSKTYGMHYGIELNEDNQLQFYMPPGFAHGFYTLADQTIVNYKCTERYDKASEGAIMWNDADLSIFWNANNPFISAKDEEGIRFKDLISRF